jgi:D-alanyl-D-alanine carboxypeptidase
MPAHEVLAAKKKKASADNPRYASLVMDAETGEILSEQNPDKPVHPASLTKVMTLLLLFDALESGNVRLNDRILISKNAAAQQPSKLGLPPGSSIRVEDAILAVVTKSANDIAAAIAEHLAGSQSGFAARMTHRARAIGMLHTTFRNPHGLHDPRQITTARDMVTLARYVLTRYPNYYRYFGTKQFTYRGKTYTNHNRLMQSYRGMDGFKTGFINASGFNLIASAKRGDRRLIGVVFGGRSWKSRNDHMASLLDKGFAKLPDVQIASSKTDRTEKAPHVDAPPQKPEIAPEVKLAEAPAPLPAPKPVFKVTGANNQGTGVLQLPERLQNAAPPTGPAFTTLSGMDLSGQQIAVSQPPPKPDIAEQAAAKVTAAIDRGDYSEVTGEGDYDIANTRRVETGLIAAAVYKGEHERARELQLASAARNTAADPQQLVQQFRQEQAAAVAPAPAASAPVPVAYPAPANDNQWSVQIGAYNSRVATDDALRLAQSRLPAPLAQASQPIVVPLKSGEGILFRGRLGGFTQAQAVEACRYFRDCLPVGPR